MKHLDLFSGIGGFALAARWAGIETIAFAETDEYCSEILRRHWPGVPNFGDVRNVRGVQADLVTGGFPCTPFSLSGERRGIKDDRYLWPEMLRIIDDSRPAFVLGENVAAIDGVALDEIISDLESIDYEVAPPLEIPACAVGADHIRNRVWILANSNRSLRQGWTSRERVQREGRPEFRPSDGYRDRVPAPGIPRRGNGVPARSHRSRALGNSIVPQVAYQILKGIAEIA